MLHKCSYFVLIALLTGREQMARTRKTYAWCDEEGLISFGAKVPLNGYPLCHGTKPDMDIVRRLAFKVDRRCYVPGDLGAKDRELVFERFAELCCERAEKPIPISGKLPVREYQSYDDWMRDVVGCRDCG